MRSIIIAANWKMNLSLDEAESLVDQLEVPTHDRVQTHLYIPSVYLQSIKSQFNLPLTLGAQNISEHEKGAYTGEISASMLNSIGIHHTLIGHSERRTLYNDTNDIIKQKIKLALEQNMTIIFCVGETLEERESNKTNDVLNEQLSVALDGLSDDDFSSIIIAYEPVWAIGTGKTATPEIAEDAHSFIRQTLAKLTSKSESISILYGGSVKSSNIAELIQKENIDGALIGGASLDADEFNKIIELVEEYI